MDYSPILDKKEELIKTWRKNHYKPEEITIYFDMDNTLALFSPYGEDEEALVKEAYNKGYYRNLECFTEGPACVKTLKKMGFKIKILSACIPSQYCEKEKKTWLRKYFPFINDDEIILIPVGKKKSDYVTDIEHSILVDDYGPNLIAWYLSGGIGIKKTYSGKKRPVPQIRYFSEIFYILFKELGVAY